MSVCSLIEAVHVVRTHLRGRGGLAKAYAPTQVTLRIICCGHETMFRMIPTLLPFAYLPLCSQFAFILLILQRHFIFALACDVAP